MKTFSSGQNGTECQSKLIALWGWVRLLRGDVAVTAGSAMLAALVRTRFSRSLTWMLSEPSDLLDPTNCSSERHTEKNRIRMQIT